MSEMHGNVTPTADSRDLDWLALRIAMLGADVDVDGPPELIAHLDALGRRLQRAAAGA